jgi:adenosylhomocysteine nucleosidase
LSDLVICVALPEEAAPFESRIRQGRLGSLRARVVATGVGARRAAATAAGFLTSARPALVICAGLAGGLASDLRRGDLFVAATVLDARHSVVCEIDGRWRNLGPRTGTLWSAPHVVGTVAEKSRAAAWADAVDMESAAVGRACVEAGVDFVALRAISDAADDEFPIDLNRYVDSNGEVQRTRLALAAMSRRGGIRFLLGLRRAALEAAERLAAFVEQTADQFAQLQVTT